MRYFDLHCDTVSLLLKNGGSLSENDAHISLGRASYIEKYAQCYAAFVPDGMSGEAAFESFSDMAEKLGAELEINPQVKRLEAAGDLDAFEQGDGRFAAVLTVENGVALSGKLENIEELRRRGVKMLTLTWNGENELGGGVKSESGAGLSDFGRSAVGGLEAAGIAVDVSHASEKLFWQVLETAKKPVAASHSNSKKLCGNERNLTDSQFLALKDSGGIVGVNFCRMFLNDEPDRASMEDIFAHAEHFLSLGGENAVAIGGDFDGAPIPEGMSGIESLGGLFELFLRHNLSESIVDRVFYKNAADFFRRCSLL